MEIDNLWIAVVGAAVVVIVVFDVVTTTVGVGVGRGPLSDAMARITRTLSHLGRPSHRRLQVAGVLGAAAVPVMWTLLVWLGFAVMFLADDDAVLVASSQEPAAALGRIAYAAGALAGAGASLVAGTETWELVNNVAAIVGLALLTLGLTYLFQVVTSVKDERAMATHMTALGSSPSEAVAAALPAPGLGTLPSQLTAIASDLSDAAQGHLTLPMLELFHAQDRRSAVPVGLATYDDILTLLQHALPEEHAPLVRTGRRAVDDFLSTITLVEDADAVPPLPSLGPLRAVRDDVVDDDTFAQRCRGDEDRRRRLLSYLQAERWSWDDVVER
ncbi:MAG: hypothetical protein KY461_02750 [Actinobacteria bacterium]|nr:hypothetical protein [Actinomycetota bacterium]